MPIAGDIFVELDMHEAVFGQAVKAARFALAWLEALHRLQREQEAAKKKELAGTITASWGDQMRSYFLYGQQLVKDLRTGTTSGSPDDVLDGDIDPFIETALAQRMKGGSEQVAVDDID